MTAPRLVRKGHSYTIDGFKAPSVTTILNALPKQLTQWSSNVAAEYAVEHWEELSAESMVKRLDRIRFAHRANLSAAALRGTKIHELGEKLAHGEPVDVPDEHRGPVEAYARFLDEWQIEPIATETPVASPEYLYAGTSDMTATIGVRDNARALVDLKSGKGVYESAVLQLAAYRYAELWQPDGPESEEPLPPVDLVYVAHIGSDNVRMLPVIAAEEEWRQFLYVQVTSQWLARHGGVEPEVPLIGDAETPPARVAS